MIPVKQTTDIEGDAVAILGVRLVWFRLTTVSALVALVLVQTVIPCGCGPDSECEWSAMSAGEMDELIPQPIGIGSECPCCPSRAPIDEPVPCPFCSGTLFCDIQVVDVATNVGEAACFASSSPEQRESHDWTWAANLTPHHRTLRPPEVGVRLLV